MRFTEEERELFRCLEGMKTPIQKRLDELNLEVREAESAVKLVRDKIAKVKPELVPYAEMQASLASGNSRDKYYPDLTRAALIKHVREAIK